MTKVAVPGPGSQDQGYLLLLSGWEDVSGEPAALLCNKICLLAYSNSQRNIVGKPNHQAPCLCQLAMLRVRVDLCMCTLVQQWVYRTLISHPQLKENGYRCQHKLCVSAPDFVGSKVKALWIWKNINFKAVHRYRKGKEYLQTDQTAQQSSY
jgi:hypothetical protein